MIGSPSSTNLFQWIWTWTAGPKECRGILITRLRPHKTRSFHLLSFRLSLLESPFHAVSKQSSAWLQRLADRWAHCPGLTSSTNCSAGQMSCSEVNPSNPRLNHPSWLHEEQSRAEHQALPCLETKLLLKFGLYFPTRARASDIPCYQLGKKIHIFMINRSV